MGTIVATRSGKIEGVDAGDHLVFKGIPFAEPPVGALRFQPPRREQPWTGTLDAAAYRPICPQNDMMLETLMGGEGNTKDEDCLSLNVWTPSLDGSRPVLVWIHGGAFQFGSGATVWYDGAKFATNDDVVVVTINYRLGPLGFLHLADLFGDEFADSASVGMLDQVAALEWVHECIASFGGDPTNVTIFGESAGGACVSTLMGMPCARPGELFHKVIAQSGAVSWTLTREQATENTRRVLAEMDIMPGDVAALNAATVDELVTASSVLGIETQGATLPFAPVVDGRSIPVEPLEAIRQGSARGVALITGTNLDEMTLFNLLDPELANITEEGLVTRVQLRYPDEATTLVGSYREQRPDVSLQDLWTVMSSDVVFRIPAIHLAEAQSQHGVTHMYLFTWATPAFGGMLKSCHAVEIPFVFDNLHQPGVDMFLGTGEERQSIAANMNAAWTAFARTGSPQTNQIPEWPLYEVTTRPTMIIDAEWHLDHDPYGAERRLHP